MHRACPSAWDLLLKCSGMDDPELGSIKRGRTYYKAVRRPFWGLKTILSRKNRKWRPKETLIRSKLNCARGVTKTLG